MNQKFTHLHVHSHYSLLDGLSKIDELLDYVKELGMDSVALTDHGNIYGAVEFYKKAKAKGIKPIIGCEFYVALDRMTEKRPNIDDKRYHLILLVKNKQGYQNLVKLVTKAHLEGFYYKPRIDEKLMEEYSEGLICLSACLQGKIPKLILSGKIKEAEKIAIKYQEIYGKENFYLELQNHPNIPEQEKANTGIIKIAKKLNIPLVATNDSHYLRPEDSDAQDILMMINTGTNINNTERMSMKIDDFSIYSPEKMAEIFKDTPEAIENTQKIVANCNFDFELGKIKFPKFPLPERKTADNYLKELCEEGINKRFAKVSPSQLKEVKERMEYELSVINPAGFASYFLIVQDFVKWAKSNRIVVGPGRGSAAGSLVAYLLGITNVDPLKYNLLFERFLTAGRAASPPDFDIDFTDRRRDEVINYVAQKYGRDKVAQIITFGTMAARAVIRDVGRVLDYPYEFCDKLAKMVPMGFTLNQTIDRVDEFRQIYQRDDRAKKIINYGKKLEGIIRHASTHACGVVISETPLDDIVPVQHPAKEGHTIVTQFEMHSAESVGLLKMDFLGLKNLTIIEDTLARIYKVQGKNINIETIPVDDKATYKLLQDGNTTSVFQLESDGMKRYLKQLKPSEFEDIIAMVALYRPGPMQFIPDYIAGKHKKKKIKYIHSELKPILESTYGIIIYQEQVLKIVQQLAGFTLSEADVLRKAIGKKIRKLLIEQKEKFIKGMEKRGINKTIIKEIWAWIEPFASYSFNRSHAACYATIAYQTAYLKAHFPAEFMAAALTSENNDVERVATLIEESRKMELEVLPPDINESFFFFSVVPNKNQIRFGLSAIKNVGNNIIEIIVKERKASGAYLSIQDFITRVSSRDLNKKSLESLIKAGAFDKIAERNQLLFNLEQLLEWSREIKKTKESGQGGLFDSNVEFKNEVNLSPTEPAQDKEKLAWEKELLGLFISGHPLDKFRKKLGEKATPVSLILKGGIKSMVRVGGIITSVKKIITKTGRPMLFVGLEDLTDKIEIVVFPGITEIHSALFEEGKILLIDGKISNRDDVPKIIANEVREIKVP